MVERSRRGSSKKSSGKPPARKSGVRSRTTKPKSSSKAAKPSANKPRPRKTAAASSRSDKSGVYIEQAGEWQVIDVHDGVTLHDPAFKTIHYLNHIAAAVFLLCKQSIDIATVSAIIQEQYELDASPEAAIRKTVNDMIRAGLLKSGKRPGAG
jgi:hypothetical protein